MPAKRKNYSLYAEHPRYGRSPNYTGLDPDPNAHDVHIHPNTRIMSAAALAYLKKLLPGWPPTPYPGQEREVVPGTAIAADASRQIRATVPVTHYYDLDTVCRDCGRHFIFFAEEQKYWYEELQLPLEADAVRCCDCRRQLRAIADQKKRYEVLCQVSNRTVEQNLEMADCCLSLIEQAIFSPRQTQHVRQLLNLIPEERRSDIAYADLRSRLAQVEGGRRRQRLATGI